MTKDKTLEEINDDFSSLSKKRVQLLLELDKITKSLVELAEKIYEKSPDYVKINCIRCNGVGSLKTEEGKKVKCDVCNLKGYMWVKKFKGIEEIKNDD